MAFVSFQRQQITWPQPVSQILFEMQSLILQPVLFSRGAGGASVTRALDKGEVVNEHQGGLSWGWKKWKDSQRVSWTNLQNVLLSGINMKQSAGYQAAPFV